MIRYEFVTVHIGRFVGAVSEEHREIIRQKAALGWRYVGFVPVKMTDYGKYKDIDLIFEVEE